MKMLKKNGGFTLVELIIVIAILAILAGVAVPAYSGYLTKANESSDLVALDSLKTAALGAYAEDGTVTKIEVTTNSGSASSVTVYVDGTAQTAITFAAATGWSDADFNTFMNGATITLKSDTFKAGAKWESTGTNASKWVKK